MANYGKLLTAYQIDGMEYHASACIDGVLINPLLPEEFDITPNDDRSDDEMALWWERPFIVVYTWHDVKLGIHRNQQRLRNEGSEYALPLEDVPAYVEKERVVWYGGWPNGDRFDVRCLDGGAWDRSTNWGQFATIEEALHCVAHGPAWRQRA